MRRPMREAPPQAPRRFMTTVVAARDAAAEPRTARTARTTVVFRIFMAISRAPLSLRPIGRGRRRIGLVDLFLRAVGRAGANGKMAHGLTLRAPPQSFSVLAPRRRPEDR